MYCESCKHQGEVCPNCCTHHGVPDGYEPKPSTNADNLIDMKDEELAKAVRVILSFLNRCDNRKTYLITPDGVKLSTDWGYVYDGLTLLIFYIMRKKEVEE